MTSVCWLVQTNLGSDDVYRRFEASCRRHGFQCHGVNVVPFSDELPDFSHDGPVLAYGSGRFIKNVVRSGRWRPGAFFSEADFTVSASLLRWGEHLVNSDAAVLSLSDVPGLNLPAETLLFVRPDDDLKAFAGEVMTFASLRSWASTIIAGDFEIGADLPIVVARPKSIRAEWRIFAVDGRAVAATRYRLDGRPAPEPGAPQEVIAFAEARLEEWTPTSALALDVAETEGGLKVMELSDLHSAAITPPISMRSSFR